MIKKALGVDIGGSHITSAVVDLDTGNIIHSSLARTSVNANGTREGIISEWCECLKNAMDHIENAQIEGIGIAMPGPFDYQQGICFIKDQNKYDSLYGLNVKELLSQKLDIQLSKIRFLNDAACFLKGETFSGAAAGCTSAIGFTLGTGLGSASFFNGVAEDANLWCSPFRMGIAEDYISARWFLRRYTELTGERAHDVKQLAEMAGSDTTVQMIFKEFGESLSEFILPILLEKQPEYIVIGGNVANAWNLFIEDLEQKVQSKLPDTKIVKAKLSEEAALIGAASLFE